MRNPFPACEKKTSGAKKKRKKRKKLFTVRYVVHGSGGQVLQPQDLICAETTMRLLIATEGCSRTSVILSPAAGHEWKLS
jgi:hypothetical protein